MKSISVIIPAFNAEAYIAQALESVFQQTYRSYEVIVIDDGSTDRTKEKVKEFNDRVKYIYQRNSGPAAARNHGLRYAIGEYISFLDADDVWLPEKLEKQVALLEKHPKTGFVYCDNYFVDQKGEEIKDYVRKTKIVRGDILLELFCDLFLLLSGMLIQRLCFDVVGAFDEQLPVGEDYDFSLRLTKEYEAEVVEEKLWKRRVHPESLSRQDFILDARTDLDILKSFVRDNPEFKVDCDDRISQRLADYHFSFAYRALEEGFNGVALGQLLQSLRYRYSHRVMKNLLLCAIPFPMRHFLKEQICQR